MRANIVRLVTTAKSSLIFRATQPTRYGQTLYRLSARWKTSGDDVNSEEEEDPVFGILRKRVLDKVGDNLNQIMKYNAFEMFGVKQQFKVDNRQLQQEMRNLQRILHPDRFVNAEKTSQEKSDYLSAAINDFYTILTNPYERGKYLLSLVSNKSPSEIERSLDGLQLDGDFLARMMDVREKISNPTCDRFELQKMGSLVDSELEELIAQLDRDFNSSNTDCVLEKLGKLKFLVNCHRNIAERCDSFSVY